MSEIIPNFAHEISKQLKKQRTMKESKLNELPTQFFNVIETTSEANGYPKNLEFAIYGFDTFEDAQAFADENELELVWLHQRDGQQLPNRIKTAYQPLNITTDDFGDNYLFYCDVDDFMESVHENVAQMANDGADLDDFKTYISECEEIKGRIENLEDDEVVVVRDGLYYKTQKLHPIDFDEDTHHIFLAAI